MEAISDFKMAAMQNVFFSIAPQWGRIDIQVVAPICLVSRTKYGSSHQLFCGGHFKIQDYRHIGSNHQRVVIGRYAVRIDSLYE